MLASAIRPNNLERRSCHRHLHRESLKVQASSLRSDRDLHRRLRPHHSVVRSTNLEVSVGIAIEDTAVVRRRPKTVEVVSHTSTLRTTKLMLILPIVTIAPAQLKVSRPVQEAHSLVFARVPAVRFFRLRACADRHEKRALGVEF